MKNVIIISLTILGLMGYLNLGGPQRLADDTHGKLQHRNLSSATQDSGGPELGPEEPERPDPNVHSE